MRKHRKMTARERRFFNDICQSAFILLGGIVFLTFCIFGKQILMLTGGFVCIFALMYIMRRL